MTDKHDTIRLDHGSGGKMSGDLISGTLLPAFDNPILSQLNDGADLQVDGARLAFSTDSFVVDPLFFPGGNIGDLAVNGTVNDLAMCGAVPLYLSVGLILEEGFPMADLSRILASMKQAAQAAGVLIVTGDTKVVPRGAADKVFINTSGIGRIPPHVHLSADRARPGDVVILSGTMADHGMTILNERENLAFDHGITSDTAPLHRLTETLLAAPCDVHVLRDPTRGGVGTTLCEIAEMSKVGIDLDEDTLPVSPGVSGLCELLGIDPLFVANEGKMLAFVAKPAAEAALAALRSHPLGAAACIIGEVVPDHPGRVHLRTRIGGARMVSMPAGEQLPRIC
jgi:hydrogenase expression/formation protein HypE